jgi:GTP pyrophosphokinase
MTPQELHKKVFKKETISTQSFKACLMALEAYNLPQKSHVYSTEVSIILADLNLDEETLIAALVSDKRLERIYCDKDIESLFGAEISKLTKGIRKLNLLKEFASSTISNDQQIEHMRQMLLTMTSDIRIMLVKLAYRVARLRNLKNEPEEMHYLIANETQLIFAPLANRLGIAQLKWELEDLSFRFLKPNIYKNIAYQLDSKRAQREEYINNIIDTLKIMFQDNFNESSDFFKVTGRPKHIYSIWKKMSNKNLSIEQLYDLRAVRIHVDTIEQCYEVLSMIHTRWNYIKKEFDDYIARPKENGYQSIHTVIIASENKTVEIQIRTQKMHYNSEYGVAAHWRYKEGTKKYINSRLEQSINLVRQILEYNDNHDLLNEISTELQSEHIYIMTPKDEIITLRKGATSLDFAYYIHTELGHRCRGAKVNNKIVPITYQLNTGDKVEILTVKEGNPNRNWLNPNLKYLATSRARTKVRSWFNQQDRSTNIEIGEALYNKEAKRLHAQNIDLNKVLVKFKIKNKTLFFENIGRGQINERQLNDTIQRLITNREDLDKKTKQARPFNDNTGEDTKTLKAYVVGTPQLNTNLAPCCKPTKIDEIIGYVTRGRGITVHSKLCNNILNLTHEEQQRLISVSWNNQDFTKDAIFIAELDILCFDRKGLLKDIFNLFSKFNINLTSSKTKSDKKDGSVTMSFSVEISSVINIGELLDSIEAIDNIELVSINLD